MSNNGTTQGLNPIPKSVREVWDVWNLRACILFSLGLQTFLILFASLRKRKASKWVITLLWSAYLLADWVAAFSLGLISNNDDKSANSDKKEELLAFWAPFLLLHLGGPDTITAFALEDNELWLRHLLGLVFQFCAAAYIFSQTLLKNDLWHATLLMFLAGLIKYGERSYALYLASVSSFRDSMLSSPDPGPNYAKLMAEYSSMQDAKLPAKIAKITEPETYKESNDSSAQIVEVEVKTHAEKVQAAYEFFGTFKGLIVDLIFSFHDRSKSRDYFLQRSPSDAFEIVGIELSFMYEVLYTKVVVIHSPKGYFFRSISFCLTLIALLLFISYKKEGLPNFDVITTYLLLIGGIVLESIAFFVLIVSDWTIVVKKYTYFNSIISSIVTKIPFINTSRWSESVSKFNLIDFCVSKRSDKVDSVVEFCGLKDFLDEIQYTLQQNSERVFPDLKAFIFNDLKCKSKLATDAKTSKEICSARGDWVLGRSIHHRLLGWSVEVEYDESLLLWHIATEILYHREEKEAKNSTNQALKKKDKSAKPPKKEDTNNIKAEISTSDHIKFSKFLSDYMLYLLVIYRDTCAEAKVFFHRLRAKDSKEACDKLFKVNTAIKPSEVKGDRSKSVLFDAVILAKELEDLKERKWELISKVWLELLSYAATNCRANNHAQQLSRGGELVTFVWLLMTHLGLGDQFRIEAGHARAKLIVEK
ncbi:hypothetical protein ACHQM5_026724 [Ranunculus cassubicifolius]